MLNLKGKRVIALNLIGMMLFSTILGSNLVKVNAAQNEKLKGNIYTFEEGDKYDFANKKQQSDTANRFSIIGDVSSNSVKNGIPCYEVNSGNLEVKVDEAYCSNFVAEKDSTEWHVVSDSSKSVNGIDLDEKIKSGAIILQVSRDGKSWITMDSVTDIHNDVESLNNRNVNGEDISAFYKTSNVELSNGCFYQVIVAYKMEREVAPTKILFVEKKNKEFKEQVEVYQFYAVYKDADLSEKLDIKDPQTYRLGDVKRVDSQDGFKNPCSLEADDPHLNWNVGKFYISGVSDKIEDNSSGEVIPVFLKVPGDKATLWFDLEQELDKCNGDDAISINYTDSGSDVYFQTPTINKWGHGTLIIKKIDKNNNEEKYIYTNYLEASAMPGANTRIDLFEEGDYEVALDYQIHYDKPFVFGTSTTKTLSYQVFFKFKVRNGDITTFIRDVDTNQFLPDHGATKNGFYVDLANSKYLKIYIVRNVLSDSTDGFVEDQKNSGVGRVNKPYTDPGIYTVTVTNPATGIDQEKTVYVGGEYIKFKPEDSTNFDDLEEDIEIDEEPLQVDTQQTDLSNKTEETASATDSSQEKKSSTGTFVLLAVVIVLGVYVGRDVYKKKTFAKNTEKQNEVIGNEERENFDSDKGDEE